MCKPDPLQYVAAMAATQQTCDCGQPVWTGAYCRECFLNSAIEGEDYIVHSGRVYVLAD